MEPELDQPGPHTLPSRLGWDDYIELPDDGRRYEILDGELFVSPSPNARHQEIVGSLFAILYAALHQPGRGKVFPAPLDVELGHNDVVQPDILFIRSERLGIIRDHVEGAPDLAVEVLSKSTRKRDRGLKARRYAKLGVQLYWIVDPFRDAIEVYRLDGDSYQQISVTRAPDAYESPDLPGVRLDLARLFA